MSLFPAAPDPSAPAPRVQAGHRALLHNPLHPLGALVALDWDPRGQPWVAEAGEGLRPARIRRVQDVDGDGVADRLTVFDSGLPSISALLTDTNGAYVAAGSHLWWIGDSDGDGRADTRTVVLEGLGTGEGGSPIRALRWGMDGWIYLSHRTDRVSHVRTKGAGKAAPRLFRGGVGRFHPGTGRFEVFADGGGNPRGLDLDSLGQAWVQDEGGRRIFPLVPGAIHERSFGETITPFAYGEQPGLVLDGPGVGGGPGFAVSPVTAPGAGGEGLVLEGSRDQQAVLGLRVQRDGAGWRQVPGTVRAPWLEVGGAGDRIRTFGFGPDDALWVAIGTGGGTGRPGRGVRLWRILPESATNAVAAGPVRNPEELDSPAWVGVLADGTDWSRRQAVRSLSRRGAIGFGPRQVHYSTPLEGLVRAHPMASVRVAALWAMHGAGLLEDGHVLLEDVVSSNLPPVLMATARIDGERNLLLMHTFKRLDQLASNPDPGVRLATLVAVRQMTSGDLVVDTPPKLALSEVAPGGIFSSLYFSTEKDPRPELEYLYWHAVEPLIAYDPAHAIGFYEDQGGRKEGFGTRLLRKILRRAADLGERPVFDRALMGFARVPLDADPGLLAGLTGLLEGVGSATPSGEARRGIERLVGHGNASIAVAASRLLERWRRMDAEADR